MGTNHETRRGCNLGRAPERVNSPADPGKITSRRAPRQTVIRLDEQLLSLMLSAMMLGSWSAPSRAGRAS